MDELFFFGDNGEVKRTVEFLLSKLPAEISEAVLGRCIVIVINERLDGYFIPADLIRDRNIIVLNCVLCQRDYRKFMKTFFHEVAHFWLKHSVLFGRDDDLEKKQEDEADRLVSEWFIRSGGGLRGGTG
jgi:hypothetical protein